MSARDRILNSVAANKPNLVPLPDMFIDRHIDRHSLQEQFIATLTKIGGTVIRVNSRQEIAREMNSSIALGEHVVNTVRGLSELTNEKLLASNATALEPVHKAYIEGTIGVAENGSIWLYESQMINRLLPFICQHLIIVLPADAIVADMHEAYKSVDVARDGYGVFLAGPSKTADIEQSLVIGAHGARSLLVYLLLEN